MQTSYIVPPSLKNMSENVLSVPSAITEDEGSSCEDIIEQSSAVQPYSILNSYYHSRLNLLKILVILFTRYSNSFRQTLRSRSWKNIRYYLLQLNLIHTIFYVIDTLTKTTNFLKTLPGMYSNVFPSLGHSISG